MNNLKKILYNSWFQGVFWFLLSLITQNYTPIKIYTWVWEGLKFSFPITVWQLLIFLFGLLVLKEILKISEKYKGMYDRYDFDVYSAYYKKTVYGVQVYYLTCMKCGVPLSLEDVSEGKDLKCSLCGVFVRRFNHDDYDAVDNMKRSIQQHIEFLINTGKM